MSRPRTPAICLAINAFDETGTQFAIRSGMIYRIGCSGYYYPQWKNKLYPKGVAPKNWLAYYSSVFNTVELNGTFYRQPKVADLKKYHTVTSDNFSFAVKMSRYITHVQRMKDPETIIKFQNLILEGLQDKLRYFLFQLPGTFQYSEENLEAIVTNVPHDPRNVIEFRHSSWWSKEIQAAFKQAKLTFCNVDYPKLDVPFMSTSSDFYLRLHGNPELFKTPYTHERLEQFHSMIPRVKTCAIYFNNTITEAGFLNALQMMNIVEEKK